MRRVLFAAVLAATLLGLAGGVIAETIEKTYEVRIVARRLDDGRTEFALQPRDGDEWEERILPARRYFPADPGHSRWLHSSTIPITVEVTTSSAPTGTATPGRTPSAPFEGEGTLGEVHYWTDRDELTDTFSTFVMVITPYVDDYGLDQSASLVVNCSSARGYVAVWLSTDEYHSRTRKVSVAYRVDGQSPQSGRWDAFGDLGHGLTPNLQDRAATGAFIDALRGGSTLRIRTPETPTLTFDISQLFDTPAQVNIDSCGS